MEQITFQEYKSLQKEIKRAKEDMNNSRYALERVAEVLKSREQMIYENKRLYEIQIQELQKQNKYLKQRLSKYEFEESKKRDNN